MPNTQVFIKYITNHINSISVPFFSERNFDIWVITYSGDDITSRTHFGCCFFNNSIVAFPTYFQNRLVKECVNVKALSQPKTAKSVIR